MRGRTVEWFRGPGAEYALFLVTFVCALAIVPLMLIVLARLIRPDTNIIFIWLNSYTFWIYLPAYPIAIFAVAARRWLLIPPAVFVIGFHLWWVLPDYTSGRPLPAEAETAPAFRLVTANSLYGNTRLEDFAAALSAQEPDVLFLQEYDRRVATALAEAGLADALPHSREAYAPGWRTGIAVYSRFPLENLEVLFVTNRPVIRADISVDGAELRIYNIHSVSPGGRWTVNPWNQGWRDYIELFGSESAPFIVAGDFNMTQHHRWYGELKEIGLKNCHEERGRGNATTWPYGAGRLLYTILPPIRIDHVFASDGATCTSISEGEAIGSDHRPVIADIAILP